MRAGVLRLLRLTQRYRHLRAIPSARKYSGVKEAVTKVSASSSVSDALQYQRKSPAEHILLRPDTYIGSVNGVEDVPTWLFDEASSKMLLSPCSYSPGLVKIFDEILVNAADNKQRDPLMTEINISIDRASGTIRVRNNGRGLPISIHPTEGIYVPTLIFGNLFTSSNYDDKRIKTVGGRNGYGAKLCNIYSKEFRVVTASKEQQRVFEQTWFDNMSRRSDAVVTDSSEVVDDDFTEISFRPDLTRFGMTSLDEATVSLMKRRAVDVAGTLPGVNVYFNGEMIEIESFRDYVSRYTDDFVYMNISPRWQVALARSSEGSFQHVSFVNNIFTPKGGKHVDYIVDQLSAIVKTALEAGSSGGRPVRSSLIRSHMFVFINSTIENPSFDSQTKDALTTRFRDFGSTALLDKDVVLEWAHSSGLVDDILAEMNNRRNTSSRPSRSLGLVSKLEDAKLAGSSRSDECTLIVTEGDSAKALAIAGLEVIGRDTFGVFPIRGKLTNVSEMDIAKAQENVEIGSLVRILGLEFGRDYSTPDSRRQLRYGQLLLFADQDEDGSHIKGLLLNLFHCFWPGLLRSGYVSSFRTPLIKVRRGSSVIPFYSMDSYRQWRERTADADKYSVKYYKGLGTSTSSEAREYFSNMSRHVVRYIDVSQQDGDSLRMAFDRGQIENRKRWIEQHCQAGPSSPSPSSAPSDESDCRPDMSLSSFVDHELIDFSLLDLRRSIPSVVDGLKPSQRKVLHTLLQRGTTADRKETKVNQLAAAVAMTQAYHHGEESLVNTIVRMAQDYTGSNNVPLLQPIGQFGTRHEGGTDAASARYIHTALSPVTRTLFPSADDPLLDYLTEENQMIEPNWYCPVVPLVLVNGAEGIGTGWATRVLNHDLTDVVDRVRRRIDSQQMDRLIPSWSGFSGDVIETGENRYQTSGILRAEKESKTVTSVHITELPVGVSTGRYKERVLGPLIREGVVRSLNEYHTERGVHFLLRLRNGGNSVTTTRLMRLFKMTSSTSAGSMVLFDAAGRLRRYNSTLDILEEHFHVRKELYERRIGYSISMLDAQWRYIDNQFRFIRSFVDGSVRMHNRPRAEVEADLRNNGFDQDPVASWKKQPATMSYLLELPLSRLTSEELSRLSSRLESKAAEREEAGRSTWQSEWSDDIDRLLKAVKSWENKRSLS